MKLWSEKSEAHSGWVMSLAFSPNGTKIVSGSFDKTIKVWDVGVLEPSKSPLLCQTLTPAVLSGRHYGAVEPEDRRPQQLRHVGGGFPRWDQDCVRIS